MGKIKNRQDKGQASGEGQEWARDKNPLPIAHCPLPIACPPLPIAPCLSPLACLLNNKGSATILTLLISAVMITVAIGFNWIVKEHLEAAGGLKAKTEAMVEARSAYDTLVYSILAGRMGRKEITLFSGEKLIGAGSLPLGKTGITMKNNITATVQDSSGLLSVVSMEPAVLTRLAKLVGEKETEAVYLKDSYIDWIDVDDLSRPNGAESSYYRAQDRPYKPRNFTMQYMEELGFIRGMTPGLYRKMEPHLTMLPAFGFNPNTAGDEALMAYLDIDRGALDKLKVYMSQKTVVSDTELFSLVNRRLTAGEGLNYFPSPYLEITIKSGSPKTVYTLNAGIDLRRRSASPFSVIYWREG